MRDGFEREADRTWFSGVCCMTITPAIVVTPSGVGKASEGVGLQQASSLHLQNTRFDRNRALQRGKRDKLGNALYWVAWQIEAHRRRWCDL